MRGVVATGHGLVSQAAADLLRSGGNAFDAIVAAGFAACVAEPGFTSLGGGGFLLARSADGRATLFDFFVDTPGLGRGQTLLEPHFVPVTVRFPASEQVFNAGLGSVAVPGVLAGLVRVHERLGRCRLSRVVAPALALARDGVVVSELQAYVLGLLTPIMALGDDARHLYAPGGRAPRAGERIANPELARLLEALPDRGPGCLYAGLAAERIVAAMEAGGGLLTGEDLAAYRVVEREPLAFDYRGARLLTNPPPSFGGTLVALLLGLVASRSPEAATADAVASLEAWAECLVEVDRRRAAGDVPRFGRGTTHASVADAEGNVASMTTSNGEGSGYVVPGTGVMLNNMLGEDDLHPEGFHASPPGQRVASMMSPTLALRDGAVRLALGSGGSKRIRTAIPQVASRVLAHGAPLEAAVAAPRLHWDGERLQVEPGLPGEALEALGRRWPLNLWPERNLYFGGVHAVAPPDAAAGDPRRDGAGLRVA